MLNATHIMLTFNACPYILYISFKYVLWWRTIWWYLYKYLKKNLLQKPKFWQDLLSYLYSARRGYPMVFCEIFYFLTNITYIVLHTDRTIFPIPFSALFPTALLPANALVSLAWLVLCVEDMCCVTTQVHAHMMPSWCLITGCQLKIIFR